MPHHTEGAAVAVVAAQDLSAIGRRAVQRRDAVGVIAEDHSAVGDRHDGAALGEIAHEDVLGVVQPARSRDVKIQAHGVQAGHVLEE